MSLCPLRPACFAIVTCLVLAGCQSSSKTTGTDAAPGAMGLCTSCGQIDGSDQCCRPGAATCPECGLVKGSPGCCKMRSDA